MKTDLQDVGISMWIAPEFRASVRLDSEKAATLSEALSDIPGEIWLFGSRTDLSRRGGDIDILVLTDQPAFETSQTIATRFFPVARKRLMSSFSILLTSRPSRVIFLRSSAG